MLNLLNELWSDDAAFVASSETILFGTILLIGSIAGLVTVRDAVATELGDLANGLLNLDHSYSYAAIVTDCGTVAGSEFVDNNDFCQPFLSDDSPPVWIGPVFIGVPSDGGNE